MPVLDRFLKYVTIDTRADDSSTSVPTTPGQLVLLDLLAGELRELGLTDVERDANGYLFATIPSTVDGPCPTIGFIAHVDTSPEMSGTEVTPIVHRDWDGSDIVLPDDRTAILRVADWPELRDQIGHDVVTASGTTLLGGDDKAGVAAIMSAAEYLVSHPSIPHGPIRLGFTPDEEIGRGPTHFDVARFGAVCAYALDGGAVGELEMESFSADAMVVSFIGFNTHPGYAKGRMINAIKTAARFIDRLPHDSLSPETTGGYEGFVHPYQVQASVDRTSVRLIIRDFETSKLAEKEAFVERIANAVAAETGASVEIAIQEQYRNMREVLDKRPEIVERARTAIRRAGLEPKEKPIRGGTDGSRLSFMGLPTPNLFAGEHNFHSRLEWTSRQDMEKAVEAIVQLAQVWAEER